MKMYLLLLLLLLLLLYYFALFQVAGFESDCLFKANERMVLRIYLTTLTVDDLSDMTLYPKVSIPTIQTKTIFGIFVL